MALIEIETDNQAWSRQLEKCEKIHREIMQTFSLREQEPRSSNIYAKLTTNVRMAVRHFTNEINQLKIILDQQTRNGELTVHESDRRTYIVDGLYSKLKQVQHTLGDHGLPNTSRQQLYGGSSSSAVANLGVSGWGDEEEDVPQVSVQDLKQQQVQILDQQDAGLEVLSQVISRQKEMARAIGNEVDVQNELIDDIADHVDLTQSRIARQTTQITVVDKKDSTWCYWILIILLFIAIIVALSIPHNKPN